MKDKAEVEFEKVRKRHSQHIKIATINFDKNNKLESVDIQLKGTAYVYLLDFKLKTRGNVNIDVYNSFQVRRVDILNGTFEKSFDGFYRYDAKGKLELVMGLGYLFSSDIEIITPKRISSYKFEGTNVSVLVDAYDADSIMVYQKKESAGQSTDKGGEQRPAGIGAAKGKVSTFVYIVREIKSVSEKSGLPIYGKLKQVSVRRVDQKSAENYVKSMYSYKKTGKLYFVELKSIK